MKEISEGIKRGKDLYSRGTGVPGFIQEEGER